ncbi:LptF/LptG family permease [Psychrobacter lutiphocae]|uniref:LptF/LptG family permease n=1 Tax=Psychrobacter lutiphocae TaxID=540500 RepID=UPI00036AE07D|nr:LptF/LptG family permease [Psychrobacter lutiphocae]
MKQLKSGRATTLKQVNAGKLLSRYVKKNALYAMLFSVIGLSALQIIFSYLSELDNITDSYTYVDALTYIAYRSPYFLEQFTPTGALLGAVIGLGLLANNSELIVMRAVGMSIYRIIGWVLQPAILFVVLALAINQYVLPETNLKASQIRKPEATALLSSVHGYWTIQKTPDTRSGDGSGVNSDHNIIFIGYADANGNIGEVKRWYLDADNNLTAVSRATGGIYLPQANVQQEAGFRQLGNTSQDFANYQWQLQNVTTLKLADKVVSVNVDQEDASIDLLQGNEPLVAAQTESSDIISLPISPSSVYLLTRHPDDLSLTQLYEHKRFNASQGTRSLEHEVAFWEKLLSPLAILSLVVVAGSFVFGSLRTHSLGLRIVVALIFGLLFSYFQDLVGYISLATGASPLLMVLLPIIGSTAFGLYLIKRQG